MSQLELVAAAMSSILDTPVKTYDDYVATGYDIESAQVLDLNAIHGNSLMLLRPSDEDEHIPSVPSGLILYSPSAPSIQIFIKTLSGDSHAMFVSKDDTVLKLKRDIQEKFGYNTTKMRLEFATKELQDFKTLSFYNIKDRDNIYILYRLLGGYDGYVVKKDLLSPSYDYDFTNLKDDGTTYTRGRHLYKRPYGWQRFALNVLGKFGSDDKWLGSVGDSPDEWPVSYHGTFKHNAEPIAGKGYVPSVSGSYGPGVYSSPEVSTAEKYARVFSYHGISYKAVFQNRVNPDVMKKYINNYNNDNEWIVPDKEGIRPYGLCLKVV